MKKTLLLFVALLAIAGITNAQSPENTKEIVSLLESSQTVEETQIISGFIVNKEGLGDVTNYVFRNEDRSLFIRVHKGRDKSFSIDANFKLSLPQEYYLFKYDTNSGVLFVVSNNGKRSIINASETADIILLNRQMENDAQTVIVEPNAETRDKFLQAQKKLITSSSSGVIKEKQKPQTDLEMLAYQNDLLKKGKQAMIVCASGVAFSAIGGIVAYAGAAQMAAGGGSPVYNVGLGCAITGAAAAAVGGIWWFINEYKMKDSQIRINDALNLRFSPNGISLQF